MALGRSQLRALSAPISTLSAKARELVFPHVRQPIQCRLTEQLVFTHLPIVILSALGVIQVEDKVPDLDTGRECRVETRDGSGYDLNHCIADETEARQQILDEWASFAADDRRQCAEEVATAGDRSYVELLTCLEMARDVRRAEVEAPQERRKPADPRD